MTTSAATRLPEYQRPPVQELVIGCRFDPPQQQFLPHIGTFWSTIRSQFPVIEHKEPLAQPSGELAMDAVTGAPLPRVWCLSEDRARVLQIQVDGLILNWRRVNSAVYPRFSVMFSEFIGHLANYRDHMETIGAGTITLKFAELSYNNLLAEAPASIDPANDTRDVLTCFGVAQVPNPPSLGPPRNVNWQTGFALPAGGAISFKLSQGLKTSDPKVRTSQLEISAVHRIMGKSLEEAREWYEAAHIAIVRAFSEVTDIQIQRERWGRDE